MKLSARNPAFFQKNDSLVESSKAISQRCRAARKSGFLNLSSNNIRELPESVFGEPELDPDEKYWECEPVQKIDLSFNQLVSIPSNIGLMGLNLLTLIIRSNELTSLPIELFDCSKLRVLDVSSNKLSFLGDGFNKMIELRELQLNDNQLKSLPESLQYCTSLAVLNVSDNNLTALPGFICDGTGNRFKSINASNNCISSLSTASFQHQEQGSRGYSMVSEVVVSMPFLESFDLQKNQLGQNAAALVFSHCPAISYINLSENKLSTCPVISDCPRLSRLHLSNNRISSFDTGASGRGSCSYNGLFSPSSSLSASLVELHVNNNSLTAIPDDMVRCLSLKVLDISNNNIGDLNCCLGYIKSLQRIAVEGNPIRTIRRTVLTESTVNLKTYLRSRCSDPDQVLHFETIQNMQEDPAVRQSLLSQDQSIAHQNGGTNRKYADGGENLVVIQRARDSTGNMLDLSGLQLQAFPSYIIPSLYRCDAITSGGGNSGRAGGFRGEGGSENIGGVPGRRFAANLQKQSVHGFGSESVAEYNSSIIENSKFLCVSEVNLSNNLFSQLPGELHDLGGSGGSAGHNQQDDSGGRGITSLNLSHNKLGASNPSNKSTLELTALPAYLEHLNVCNNNLNDADLHTLLSSCVAGSGSGSNGSNSPSLTLKFFLCSNNRLQNFLPNCFVSALSNLREVQMSHNALTSLENVPFYQLKCLEIVNFTGNQLSSVGRLWEAPHLRTVMLDNNNLQTIPPELSFLVHLTALSIHGNPQKGVRFDVIQKGTEAIILCLKNKLTTRQTSVQQLTEIQRDMGHRLQLDQGQGLGWEDQQFFGSNGRLQHENQNRYLQQKLQFQQHQQHVFSGSAVPSGRSFDRDYDRVSSNDPVGHGFGNGQQNYNDSRSVSGGGSIRGSGGLERSQQDYASGDNSLSLSAFQQNRGASVAAMTAPLHQGYGDYDQRPGQGQRYNHSAMNPPSLSQNHNNSHQQQLSHAEKLELLAVKTEIQELSERIECSSTSTMKRNELKRELARKRAVLARLS